jgi:hypothetical protein
MYDNSVRLIGFLGQNAEKRTARNKTPYVILNLRPSSLAGEIAEKWGSF